MLIRLILIIGIIYLGLKVRKAYKAFKLAGRRSTAGRIDDVMVKDPFCEMYFPQREGVHVRVGGKDLYFCSEKCRDAYLASLHGK